MSKNDIEIYVATHKKINYRLPNYCFPIQVNCKKNGEHWEGYFHDDYADNISEKNNCYCELTALYSLWKNSNADIKGLFHYRRFFGKEDYYRGGKIVDIVKQEDVHSKMIDEESINKWLRNFDIIIEMPSLPYPKTAQEDLKQYVYDHDKKQLDAVIEQYYPDYLETYRQCMNSTNLSYCNMMIASKNIFDNYCKWVFDVLQKVEELCDITGYDQQHQRIYGFMSEVLMNVYIVKNKLKAKYIRPCLVYDYVPDLVKAGKRVFINKSIKQFLLRVGIDVEKSDEGKRLKDVLNEASSMVGLQ